MAMGQTQRKPVFFIVNSKLIFVVFCFMGLMYILIHEIITVIIERQVFNGIRSVLLRLRLYAEQRACYFPVSETDHCLFIAKTKQQQSRELFMEKSVPR